MYLGIDVGSISVKFALYLPPGGGPPPDEATAEFLSPEPISLPCGGIGHILSYDRHQGDPNRLVPRRLEEWVGRLDGNGRLRGVAVTGKSGQKLSGLLGARYENDFRCLVKAVSAAHPDVATIFEMGGENAKVIRLERGENGGARIRDYDANGDCAAGTGSFIDQQANRLNLAVEEIGGMVVRAASAARIAGRCSVFAKSDMIHAQQKGYTPEEILKGL
jgi:activator of 2-hydroxyglutaryl-CoA dehydratase